LPKSSDARDGVLLELHGVSKRFQFHEHGTRSVREAFIHALMRGPSMAPPSPESAGLFDIDLCVRRGESLGLVGDNGHGKSTLLRVMAGIYPPSTGRVERHGRVSAVLDLGAGLNPELSGNENLELGASVLGASRRELAARRKEILDFAEVGDVLETPLKYWSTGMRARLAFSLAIGFEPDALLLDEVLAVGDQAFQRKCRARIRAFRDGGGTLVIVSHDLDQLREICSRGVWLRHGHIVMDGEIGAVLDAYQSK
jgi:ABC-type polysaccharide/polyol phosphate transport system ATPase subunit